MTPTIRLPFIILLLVALGAGSAAFTARADTTATGTHAEYRVRFSADNPRSAQVSARLTLNQGTIKMLPWGHPWLPTRCTPPSSN